MSYVEGGGGGGVRFYASIRSRSLQDLFGVQSTVDRN